MAYLGIWHLYKTVSLSFANRSQMLTGLDYLVNVVCYNSEGKWPKGLSFSTIMFTLERVDNCVVHEPYDLERITQEFHSDDENFSTMLLPSWSMEDMEEEAVPKDTACIQVEHEPGYRYITCDTLDSIAGINTVASQFGIQPRITQVSSREDMI